MRTDAPAFILAMREGYGLMDLRADLFAGITVGVIALPLAMALAISTGVPPQHGLYTAIVAGVLVALTGGSRYSVAGPTAAFIVILHPISVQFGLGGLLLATFMAGVIQMMMGIARLGRLVEFIPHPVTTGFTAGIAVVIASLQLQDFFGLVYEHEPGHLLERLIVAADALQAPSMSAFVLGTFTLIVILAWSRLRSVLPPQLAGVAIASLAAFVAVQVFGVTGIETIGSRFGEIPRTPPVPLLPWRLPGADGAPLVLSLELIQALVRPAFAIAMLGAIESLLCAVVADGMSGSKHDPNRELIGQGLGNTVVPFFGGIAATGALARSAANVRAGARTPMAAIFHSLFVLVAVLALAPLLAWLPMAALAALLLWVAWNMAEAKHFIRILRRAPKSDISVMLTCFVLTAFIDMVLAVGIGVVLAALLFMKRMSGLTGAREITDSTIESHGDLPEGVYVYEIAGPLFFGAAERAMSAFSRTDPGTRRVVLNMGAVPAMDITGLIALETAIARLNARGIGVSLAGVQPQPMKVLLKAGLGDREGLSLHPTLSQAIAEG